MSRHTNYMGCKVHAKIEDLSKLEATGKYVAEEKLDGEWAECRVLREGNVFTSRNNLPIESKTDKTYKALLALKLPDEWEGSVLIGEFEGCTQKATEDVKKRGYRQFIVYDVLQFSADASISGWQLEKRRAILERMWELLTPDQRKLFVLVRRWEHGFAGEFKRIVAEGGEGLVLKLKGMPYEPKGADGKVDHWQKVKKLETQDMIVMGLGYGEKTGDITSLRCGLYVNGKLTEVCKIGLGHDLWVVRKTTDWNKWMGKVVETEGFEVFKSGAVRSGGVKRLRLDKPPEDCVLIPKEEA